MMPKTWIAVDELLLTTSGKMEEEKLQLWTKAFREQESDRRRPLVKHMPSTSLEKALQKWWNQVLAMENDAIDLDSKFFVSGGDLISSLE